MGMSFVLHPIEVVAVDDEPNTRAIVATLLRKFGVAVATCASGGEMWDALTQHRPRVLILDVEMPGEDGFVLAEQVRARLGFGIHIIMLTARGGGTDKALALEAGADEYLTKPCDWRKLVNAVQRALAHGAATPTQTHMPIV